MNRKSGVMQSSAIGALAIMVGGVFGVHGQELRRPSAQAPRAAPDERPEMIVQNALRANPVTAPYAIAATWRKNAVVLSGRVGTKQVHDTAVQLAIACGVPVRDDLVIDTAETARVAMSTGLGVSPGAASASYYVYPPPLFGRLDDPFFGFLPPLVSFPPWWPRAGQSPMLGQAGAGAQVMPPGGALPRNAPGSGNGAGGWQPLNVPPVKGQVDMTVDAMGQVFLRGVVASEEDRREIEDAARSVPGVTRVESQLQVGVAPRPDQPYMVQPRRDPAEVPPPPPQPFQGPASRETSPTPPGPGPVQPAQKPATNSASALDAHRLTRRVVDAINRRPIMSNLPIKVRSSDDVVTLSGHVPSAFEAMMAFRAAQQIPGVRDVVDRLDFDVPDEDHPNPLLRRGRPEDLEPYLTSQIRRHVGDLAHIDRVGVRGDVLEVRGTLANEAERDRVLAILRSTPVLHGFKLEPTLTLD